MNSISLSYAHLQLQVDFWLGPWMIGVQRADIRNESRAFFKWVGQEPALGMGSCAV